MRRTTLSDASRYSTITATRSIDTDERFISSMLAVEYSLVCRKKRCGSNESPQAHSRDREVRMIPCNSQHQPLSGLHLRLQAPGANRRGLKEVTTLDAS